MKKFAFTLFVVLLFGLPSLVAQNIRVTGTVRDADGQPLMGATVVVDGNATRGTATALDGTYTLEVPSNSTLNFTFIGMIPVREPVNGRSVIDVRFENDAQVIREVIISVPYGTVSKEAYTGSSSQIKADDIGRRQVSNVTTALAGQVAGLQMIQNSGQPGSTSAVRIRGFGSINASSAPLYVVDGVPYTGDITGINPADIESISVLKDAASNSLYGARGANGVIMITTKRGRAGEAVITFDSKWGINTRAVPEYDIFTTSDADLRNYYATYWQAVRNSSTSLTDAQVGAEAINNLKYQLYTPPAGQDLFVDGKINPAATLGYWNAAADNYLYPDNWSKAAFNNALRQEYNATVSGASEKINYFFSAGYLNDKGYAVNSHFDRISGRLKADYQARKWLKLTANVAYANVTANAPENSGTGSANLFYYTRHQAPIYPLYVRDQNGNIKIDVRGDKIYDYGDLATGGIARPFLAGNPVRAQYLDKRDRIVDLLSLRTGAEITFVKGLKGTFNVGYDLDNTRLRRMGNPYYGQSSGSGGSLSVEAQRNSTLNLQQLLNYTKSFGDHNLDVLLGHEYYAMKSVSLWALGYMLFNPEVLEVDNTLNDNRRKGGSSGGEYFTEGYFGRLSYDYNSRYFLSASYRRDASSRFAPENRWGNFWSAGASWIVSHEKFMQNVLWVDLLKLKASYGTQGNDGLLNSDGTQNYYPYTNWYVQSNVAGVFGVSRSYVGNRNISWEDNQNFNTGIEFSLWGEKLSGSVEYFVRTTRKMLFNRPVPSSIGYTSYPDNIGDMRNAGYEIDLQYTPVRTDKLTWNIYANATHIKNKILLLPPESREAGIPSSQFRYKEGHGIYDFYLREWAGVNEAGAPTWWKYNDDGSREATTVYIDATERFVGKTSVPKLYGGFGTSLYWGNLDVNIAFSYQFGGWGLDQEYARLMNSGHSNYIGNNWHKDILNAWSPTHTNTDIPKVNTGDLYGNNIFTTRFLTRNDFLSLQNVTIGYTLPRKWTEKLQISSLRIYAVADNVWLLTARKGYDPRMSYSGTSSLNYGLIRTVSGGVSFKF